MKYKLIAIPALMVGMQLHAAAQKSTGISACWYEAGDSTWYSVSNCAPGSEAAFYSEPDGGRCLLAIATNSKGQVTIAGKNGFAPAMVVNHSLGAVTGTNMSAPLGEKQFTLKDIVAEAVGQQVNISWKGAALAAAGYTFEVQKRLASGSYVTVNTQPATGEILSGYFFSDVLQAGENAAYRLFVYNSARTIDYTSPDFYINNSGVKVYPTAVSKNINIVPGDVAQEWHYNIVNSAGAVVRSGRVDGMHATLALDELAPGNYIISIAAAAKNMVPAVFKFTRL